MEDGTLHIDIPHWKTEHFTLTYLNRPGRSSDHSTDDTVLTSNRSKEVACSAATKQTNKQINRQANKRTKSKQASKQSTTKTKANKQKQTNKQANKQTNKQTKFQQEQKTLTADSSIPNQYKDYRSNEFSVMSYLVSGPDTLTHVTLSFLIALTLQGQG